MAHGTTRREFAAVTETASLTGIGFSALSKTAETKPFRAQSDLPVLDPIWRRHLPRKSEIGYSAIPCSTVRHSKSSAILSNSVAQIPSCSIISGLTALFPKSRHRLASPKRWLTSRISVPNLVKC